MISTELASVCNIEMGQAPAGSSYNSIGEGLPLLAGAGDFGVDFPAASKFTSSPTKVSAPNDIIMCIRATIGDLNWSDRQYCLGRGVAGLRPKPKSLDRNYLWHWLSYARADLEKKARGSTFKQVSKRDVAELEIPLPNTLDEQRRIAAILDKADAIRRKREQVLTLADDFLRSVFLEMFDDPENNSMNWTRRKFEAIAEIDTRMVKPTQTPFIDMPHVGPEIIVSKTGKILQPKTAREEGLVSGKYLFDDCHILYTKIRPLLQKVAMPTFAGLCSADVYPIKPIKGVSTKEFLWAVLISDAFVAYFHRLPDRANIPKMNMKELNAYECIYPPFALQEEFSKIVRNVRQTILKLEVAYEQSSNLFASLSQRAFAGEL